MALYGNLRVLKNVLVHQNLRQVSSSAWKLLAKPLFNLRNSCLGQNPTSKANFHHLAEQTININVNIETWMTENDEESLYSKTMAINKIDHDDIPWPTAKILRTKILNQNEGTFVQASNNPNIKGLDMIETHYTSPTQRSEEKVLKRTRSPEKDETN